MSKDEIPDLPRPAYPPVSWVRIGHAAWDVAVSALPGDRIYRGFDLSGHHLVADEMMQDLLREIRNATYDEGLFDRWRQVMEPEWVRMGVLKPKRKGNRRPQP